MRQDMWLAGWAALCDVQLSEALCFCAVWSEPVTCFVSPALHKLDLEPNRHFTLAVDSDVHDSLIIPS